MPTTTGNVIFGLYTRVVRHSRCVFGKLFSKKWRDPALQPRSFGNRYGCGYCLPGLLDESSLVYSFGVGEDISFDLTLIELRNCHVVGFDPTPKSIEWVRQNVTSERFSFMPYGLSKVSGRQRFYLPADENEVSGSMTSDLGRGHIECEFLCLEDILLQRGDSFVDLVKMDIEGEEYNLFQDWLDRDYRPPIGQIWVEFHPHRAGSTNRRTAQFVKSLERIGLICVPTVSKRATNHYLLLNEKYLARSVP